MTKFLYGADGKGKLIHDKIDKDLLKAGHVVESRILAGEDLIREILKKFSEELDELGSAVRAKNSAEEKEELADLLTLIEAYVGARNFDMNDILQIKKDKIAQRGSFDGGLFVEWIDLNPNAENYDFWLKYFRKRPEGYIESREGRW